MERKETMDPNIQMITDTFIAELESDETIRAFRDANAAFEKNEDLQSLRARYSERMQELQQKQMEGTLTQDEIDRLRAMQTEANNHPVTVEFLRYREDATRILEECNRTISEILGFDYSATAAPAAAC